MSILKISFWIKQGLSEDEAKAKVSEIQKSNNRKRILKYTKEERRKQSTSSIDYYINKGLSEDEAIFFLSERQSTFSLEKCIKKYGEEEGSKKWLVRQEKWQNTLKNKSEEETKKISLSKANSLEKCIKKYGEENGKLEWEKIKKSRDSSSMEWAIRKCNGDFVEAKKLFEKRNKHFNKFLPGRPTISKESILFFIKLYRKIRKNTKISREDIYWGIRGSKEYYIKDVSTNKFYSYDFTIPKLNLIIEYNGVVFHSRIENNKNYKHPFNKTLTSEIVFNNDKNKRIIAEKNNFQVYYIWSDENKNNFIHYIMEIINERIRNIA